MTMEITSGLIVFAVLALIIVVFSFLAVTSRRILRAVTYLLFVLFATAGLYFQLDYQFLGAVQLTIYAGGIIVLYVFSILLTSGVGEKAEKPETKKVVSALMGRWWAWWFAVGSSFPSVSPRRWSGERIPT